VGGRPSCGAPPERDADDDEHRAEGEEAEVPPEGVGDVVPHVVDAEQVVVDDALDQVEPAPPGEEEPAEATPPADPSGAGQEPDPEDDEQPGDDVEQPVPERVLLERPDRGVGERGVAVLGGEQVVPLQDLVQDDAVEEAAETDAEGEAAERVPS
jgi:hypothetical protein